MQTHSANSRFLAFSSVAGLPFRRRFVGTCCEGLPRSRGTVPLRRVKSALDVRCSERAGVVSVEIGKDDDSILAEHAVDQQVEASETESDDEEVGKQRRLSLETRKKISNTMLGVPKSAAMRAKLSASMRESMKNRPPWNKGKKLSAETRKRMSETRKGRSPWNKGTPLSDKHKEAISAAHKASSATVSDSTRRLLQLSRRRPGDAIVTAAPATRRPDDDAGFPLVDTADIHSYVTLRRKLRVWSDSFAERIGRRPTLADVRRTASLDVVRDFEQYVAMRGAIRGLANDVCGDMDPNAIPVMPSRGYSATSPQNNNARSVHTTSYGNRRLASDAEASNVVGGQGSLSLGQGDIDSDTLAALGVTSTRQDMWDAYDRPITRPSRSSGFQVDRTLFGTHELDAFSDSKFDDRLDVNDFRMIGRYRLMESKDINSFVQLRRELELWSALFKKRTGRTPSLSDVRKERKQGLYIKFLRYLDMRDSMSGLVREVYGTDIDQLETTCDRVTEEAQSVLDRLQRKDHDL